MITRWLPLSGLLLALAVPALCAQAVWDARLAISPYPSPYLSDWQSNPSIGTLTITNPTASDQHVLLAYRVTDGAGRMLASGRSTAQLIPAGPPTVITDFINMTGTSQHDATLETQMRRTGRLPEGDNTACVDVTDTGGFVLADDCATFSIVYPDPPFLTGPLDDAALASGYPIFQWTPLQVPPAFRLSYVVRVSEVLAGQIPLQALSANIPVFEATTSGTSLAYPIGALPLVEGKTYAWRVQALDQNGYPASANDGRSEIWTFRNAPEHDATPGATRSLAFTLSNAYDQTTASTTSAPPPTYAPTTYRFQDICDSWDTAPPDSLALDVNVPFGFHGFRADSAVLYRANDPASRNASHLWWVLAWLANGPGVLVHGNCAGILGGLQWVAMRTPGVEQTLSDFIGGGATGDGLFQSLDFGIWVAALHSGSLEVPDEFALGQAFLEGHDDEVKTGLNAIMVLGLREGGLSPIFDWLGVDEPQVTLTGFVGLDATRSIGAGLGGDNHASVSQQRSFLLLTAALPERTIDTATADGDGRGFLGQLFQSSQWSFEFEIQDSTGVSVSANSQTKRSLDYVFRVKNTLTMREDRFGPHRAMVGWFGADIVNEREQQTLDVARRSAQRLGNAGAAVGRRLSGGRLGNSFGQTGTSCAAAPAMERHVDFVANYTAAGQWNLGAFYFEDPAVELHIDLAKQPDGSRNHSLAFVTTFGVEGFDQKGILGFSRTSETDDAKSAESACRPTRPRANSDADLQGSPTRPRSDAISGPPEGRPRSDATAAAPQSDLSPGQTNPAQPAPVEGPKSHWEVRLAWDIVPLGAFGKITNALLMGGFAFLGLGGL